MLPSSRLRSSLAAALVLACAGSLPAGIVNGSFETGDYSGWQVVQPTFATVVTGANVVGDPMDVTPSAGWTPTHGDHFAYLAAGAERGRYTLLSQAFNATAGQVVSFDIFFDGGDYLPFNDNGFANVLNLDTLDLDNLYLKSISDVGDYGEHGWQSVSYTIPTDGEYRLLFGVNNDGDNLKASYLGVDNVVLGPRGGGQVPEPATLAVWGLLGLGGVAMRRRVKTA